MRWAWETPGWRASPPRSSLAWGIGCLVSSVCTIRRRIVSQEEIVAKLWFGFVAAGQKVDVDVLGNICLFFIPKTLFLNC